MGNRYQRDEIVEERTWRSGVEVVSHVNWSQLARVRRCLGLMSESVSLARPVLVASDSRVTLPGSLLPRWHPKAA